MERDGAGKPGGGLPPHPATVARPARPPHPATVVQPKPAIGKPAARPPHPATVVQRKPAIGKPATRSPHPATVGRPPPHAATLQMRERPGALPPHPATLHRLVLSNAAARARMGSTLAGSSVQRMEEDDLFGNVDQFESSSRQPNTVKWKGVGPLTIVPDNVYVKKVYLRGSWTSGSHQEVLCALEGKYEGRYIRVSRTNGEDTFQYNAGWEHEKQTNQMPVLAEADPKDKLVAVGTIVMAFLETHKRWNYYDQADCQAFAQQIYKLLTGTSVSSNQSDSDDTDLFI